jgi:hypothetical protein
MDWREIDPAVHTWEEGLAGFKNINEKIIRLLNVKDDTFFGRNS